MFARIVPIATILSLVCATCPAPALATSTATEIRWGSRGPADRLEQRHRDRPAAERLRSGHRRKPLEQVARKDVPYYVKIIKANDVNSFATLGGFVYIYEGLIDFVQSDDELASVMGHETGHIERRHVLTATPKRGAGYSLRHRVAVLAVDLQIRRPRRGRHHGEDPRADELQADRYGLQLMSRAGYDPKRWRR